MTKNEENKADLDQSCVELSEFAHVIRHDIRNFIAAIEGYIFLLKDEFKDDYLERIQKNSKQIGEVIDLAVEIADSSLPIDLGIKVDLHLIIKACKVNIPESIQFQISELKQISGNHSKILQIFKQLFDVLTHQKGITNIEIKAKEIENYYIIEILFDGEPFNEKIESITFPKTFKQKNQTKSYLIKKLLEAHLWEIETLIGEKNGFIISIPSHLL